MQHEPSAPAAPAANLRDETATRALMRFHATQFEKATWVVLAALLAFLYTLLDRVSRPALLAWVCMTVAVGLWRHLLSKTIRERAATASAAQLQRYETLVLASTALSSTAVGASFWLIALQGDLYIKLVVTLFSMTHMMAVLGYATPDIPHRTLRTVGNIGQGVLFWLGVGSGDSPRWEVLAAYCGLWWMSVIFGREHLRQFRESLAIRSENAALLLQVQADKRLIEGALRDAQLANESKNRFLAAASHDLRQPLHALTMFLGTMTFHVTTDDAKRLLGRIKETVQVLEEQFNSLLDLSRFDAGAVAPDLKPFRLDSHIERLIDEFRPLAEAKHLELAATLCPAIARSDPLLIGRVLRNLLDNAVKYTTAGTVSVRVTAEPDSFVVEVSDTGPGIAADQQTRIFDEYVQLTNPGRQRQRGVGLGLAIVKRIDQLLGLKLRLHSAAGAGSQFRFTVPAAGDIEVPLRRSAPSTATFHTSASIWILDDDQIALEGLQEQLSAWGASVTAFARPEELLAKLRAGAPLPHWILSDDMLGASLSGLETAQILSRQFGFGKVCLITGNTEPARLAELQSSGFPVIVKPARPEQLIAVMGT